MTNRIETNQVGPVSSPQSADEQSVDEASQTEAGAVEGQEAVPSEHAADVWEKAGSSPYDSFLGNTPGDVDIPTGPVADVDAEEAKAVWEMMGVGQSEDGAGDDGFVIADNQPASSLATIFDQMEGDNATETSVRRDLNALVFDGLDGGGRQELIELAGHPDELRDHLLEIHGDTAMADHFVDQVQDQVVGYAGEAIADKARPQLQASMESIEQLNASSDSRRAFLSTLATGVEERQDMSAALAEIGMSQSAADDIAAGLDELRGDDEAMSAFLAGDDGERSGLLQFRGDFAQIEGQFERELGSMHQGLESLSTSLDTNQIRHDQFLTDPITAPIRDEVFADMGAITEPAGEVNGLGEMFNEATDQSSTTQRNHDRAIAAINVLGSVGFTAATAGVGAPAIAGGAAVGAAQATPDVADAHLDVDRAQGAVAADLQNPELIEMAETDRNVAYALATASTLAGAIAHPGDSEVAGATLEAASLAYDE